MTSTTTATKYANHEFVIEPDPDAVDGIGFSVACLYVGCYHNPCAAVASQDFFEEEFRAHPEDFQNGLPVYIGSFGSTDHYSGAMEFETVWNYAELDPQYDKQKELAKWREALAEPAHYIQFT